MSEPENKELNHKHLFDGSDMDVYDKSVLNLGVGAPGPDLLENCCKIFQTATEHRMEIEKNSNQSLLFQYGPRNGNYNIRFELSEFLTKVYNNPVKCEDLIMTSGASQGLQFVLSTLLDLNGYVFVDEFTYMMALASIKQFHTLQLISVKLTDKGVNLQDFESKIKDAQFKPDKSKMFWAMYYTVTSYHNPTGITFSAEICRGLVELARKYDFLVLCDDVYNVLHYSGARLYAHLLSYDGRSHVGFKGNVISNGSFSKIVGPGIRLGWMEVPPRIMPKLINSGFINSGGCFNNYTSGIAASLFELKLMQSHIASMIGNYKHRMMKTLETLRKHLPKSCVMIPPNGGYFIWIQLPFDIDAQEFLDYCLENEKISFLTGDRFAVEDGKGTHHIRLSIAFYKSDILAEGVERLCKALVSYIMALAKPKTPDNNELQL